MSSLEKNDHGLRSATLKLSHGTDLPVLTARVPSNLSREELSHVTAGAYALISKLTGHPCLSGRIKFVVEDNLLNEITRVDLKTGAMQ